MTNLSSLLIGRIVCSLTSDNHLSAELKWAISLAGHFDATLDVLQIRDAPDGIRELKFVAFEEHSRHLMRCLDSYQRFDQLVQAAGASIRVATFRTEGPAVAAVLQHAKQSNSDLVILSSSQVVATIDPFSPDIGRAIGEMVGCALLTVKRGEPPPVFQRILLPVDFSAGTNAAMEWAVAFSRRFGSSIHLLHVVPETRPEIDTDSNAQSHREARIAAARGGLDQIEAELRTQGVAVASACLTHDDTVRAIVAQYAAGSFDLIVMGLNTARPTRARTRTIARIRQNHDVSLLSVGTATPHAECARKGSLQSDEESDFSRVDATG